MATLNVTELDTSRPGFDAALTALLERSSETGVEVESAVRAIIEAVRRDGDRAVLSYSRRFDGLAAERVSDLELGAERLSAALSALPSHERSALEIAAGRIRAFHERQREQSWEYRDDDDNVLGQTVTPLERVGLYVPGGRAAYPSSVLMTAIPAKVAGVGEVVMVVPAPQGDVNPLVLAAARVSGVDRVFTIGGAQAVAALAFGTQTVPRVDKIVGPGNIFVAVAKRLVFGHVGIDMVAGPSEVVVICDETADPQWAAMDLFAQAEHDELAQSILLTPSARLLSAVREALERLLPSLERREIVRAALENYGALVRVRDLDEAVAVADRIAPEHLELMVADPRTLAARVRHAGAIFLGAHSAEALGDYCAGPNHVLPTAGTARFSSPLGVYDFQKRTSIIMCSPPGAARLAATASVLARAERLTAHARSAELRMAGPKQR
ncbi:MAG: histidinol dehydrogenase [Gammaproteobacteria bacterium]|nr:histidinol dehydrogenase [Gammaproteobacteria bacterium]NIV73303.1 histidinol dehydrogenase [Gammaproteobacteria bacterium]